MGDTLSPPGPASITVTSAADSGPGTLRAAIETANADGRPTEIRFDAALLGQAIRLLSPLPPLTADATTINALIDGDALPDVEVDGGLLGDGHGIDVQSASNTLHGLILSRFWRAGIRVGGSGNVVESCRASFNREAGVAIEGGSGNVVRGCWIGTDAAGAPLGNRGLGVAVNGGASDNRIGPDNVVAWNGTGVSVADGDLPGYPDFSLLTADYTGTFAAIDFSTTSAGAFRSADGQVPTYTDGQGNLQPFTHAFGARFDGTLSVAVAGDYTLDLRAIDDFVRIAVDGIVVLDATCCDPRSATVNLAQGPHAFTLDFFASHAGGAAVVLEVTGPGAAAFTTFPGNQPGLAGEFFLLRKPTERNTITQSSIFANAGAGIRLEGAFDVGAQDASDLDVGPNTALNPPELLGFTAGGGTIAVTGTAAPGATVEVFAAADDTSGHGEGKVYLGSAIAAAGGTFTATVASPPAGFAAICATATDADGNTSEFSRNLAVGTPPGNDEPVNAIAVAPGTLASFEVDTAAATRSSLLSSAPCAPAGDTFDVWFTYGPAAAGEILTIDAGESSYGTFVAVFADAAAPPVACAQGPVRLAAEAGKSYLVAVGSVEGRGGTLRARVGGVRPREIDVLLYDNGGGRVEEAALAALMGRGAIRSYTVAGRTSFPTLSTAEVAGYDVVLVGWMGIRGWGGGPQEANAESDGGAGLVTATAWHGAITGNVVLSGLDPDVHFGQGGEALLENLIVYAASGTGTGLVVLADILGGFGFLPSAYGVAAQEQGDEGVFVADAAHPVNAAPNLLSSSRLSSIAYLGHSAFTATGGFQVVHADRAGRPLTIAGPAPQVPGGAPAPAAAATLVLVYENGGDVSEAGALGALLERGSIRTYTARGRFTFPALSTQEIAAYDVLYVGWSGNEGWGPGGPNAPCDGYEGLVRSGARWQDAIQGNVVVMGLDPDFHWTYGGEAPALELFKRAVAFAASGAGTGFVATADAMTGFAYLPWGPPATLDGGSQVIEVDPAHPLTMPPIGLGSVGYLSHNTFAPLIGVGGTLSILHANAASETLTWAGSAPTLPRRPALDTSLPTTEGDHVVYLARTGSGNFFLDFEAGAWHMSESWGTGDGDDAVEVGSDGAWYQLLGSQVRWYADGWWAAERVRVPAAAGERDQNVPPGYERWDESWVDEIDAASTRGIGSGAPSYFLLRDVGKALRLQVFGVDGWGRVVVRYTVKDFDLASFDRSNLATYPAVPAARPSALPAFEAVASLNAGQHWIVPGETVLGVALAGTAQASDIASFTLRRYSHDGTPNSVFRAAAVTVAAQVSDRGSPYTLVYVSLEDVRAQIAFDESAHYALEIRDAAGTILAPWNFELDATPPAIDIQNLAPSEGDVRFDLSATDRTGGIHVRLEVLWGGSWVAASRGGYDDWMGGQWDPVANANAFGETGFSFSARGATLQLWNDVTYRIAVEDDAGNRATYEFDFPQAPLEAPPPPDFTLDLSDGDHLAYLFPDASGGNFFLDFAAGDWHQGGSWGQGDGDDAVEVSWDGGWYQFLGRQVRWFSDGWGEWFLLPAAAGGRGAWVPLAYDAFLRPGNLQEIPDGQTSGFHLGSPKYLVLRDGSRALKLQVVGVDAYGQVLVRYTVRGLAGLNPPLDPSDPATYPEIASAGSRPPELPPWDAVSALSRQAHVFGPGDGIVGIALAGTAGSGDLTSFELVKRPHDGRPEERYAPPAVSVTSATGHTGAPHTIIHAPLDPALLAWLEEAAWYRFEARTAGGISIAPWGFDFDATSPAIDIRNLALTERDVRFDLGATDRHNGLRVRLEVLRGGSWVAATRGGYNDWIGGQWDPAANRNSFDLPGFSFAARGAVLQLWNDVRYRIVVEDDAGNRATREFDFPEAPLPAPPPPTFTLDMTDGEHTAVLWPDEEKGQIYVNFVLGTWRYGQDFAPGDGLRVQAQGWHTAHGDQVRWFFAAWGETVDVPRLGQEPRRLDVPVPFETAGAVPGGSLRKIAAGTSRGFNLWATKHFLLADQSRALKLKFIGADAYGRLVFRYAVRNVADPAAVDPGALATYPRLPSATARPAGLPPGEVVSTLSDDPGTCGAVDGFVGFVFAGALPHGFIDAFEVGRRPDAGGDTTWFRGRPDVTVVSSRAGHTYTLVSLAAAALDRALGLDEQSSYPVRLLGVDGFDYATPDLRFDLSPPRLDRVEVLSAGATGVVAAIRARDASWEVTASLESDRTGDWRPNVLGALEWEDPWVPEAGWDGSANIFEAVEPDPFSFADRGAAPTLYEGVRYRIVLTDLFGNCAASAPFDPSGGRALPPAGRVRNERLGRTYRFIQDALDEAWGGDTITLHGGVYVEMALLDGRLSGAADAPTVLRAAEGEAPVLDGEGRLEMLVACVRADRVRIEGLRLTGAAVQAVLVSRAEGVSVRRCEADGNANAIIFVQAPGGEVDSCFLHDNDRYGILASGRSSRGRFHHNLLARNGRAGLTLQEFSGAAWILNNTIHGNGHWGGIMLYDGTTDVHIRNNIVTSNHGAAQDGADPALLGGGVNDLAMLGGAPNDPIDIAFNDVWDNLSGYRGTADRAGIDGNIGVDPRFVDAASDDFRLRSDSPLIGAGDPVSSDGDPAPAGSSIDMGITGAVATAQPSPPPAPEPAPAVYLGGGGGCRASGEPDAMLVALWLGAAMAIAVRRRAPTGGSIGRRITEH